jgi:hypothetical protein
MPLYLHPDFAFSAGQHPEQLIEERLQKQLDTTNGKRLYFGLQRLSESLLQRFGLSEETRQVDNFTRFSPTYGYEAIEQVVTLGLRQSRFAPLLFWEIFHLLKLGGSWLDLDAPELCRGTELLARDFLERDYYQFSLQGQTLSDGPLRGQRWQKTRPALISGERDDQGWTFGILTAGQSANAQQMIRTILDLPGPEREIIICGPAQENLPDDPRIRTIDLEQPEARGWITRKKNLIVDAARYSNLCLMHDRFVFPEDFFGVMGNYGNDFAFVTFPEPYYPHQNRSCSIRYPDYQVLLQKEQLQEAIDTRIFQQDNVYHPRYDDFYETAFCCGGVYVAKKNLWNLVRQDESLYHAECEDILFGLRCQQKGIPHRVIVDTCFESIVPHPLLLTAMHTVNANGEKIRGCSIISAVQKQVSAQAPTDCNPLFRQSRADYYTRVAEHFNQLPMVGGRWQLMEEDYREAVRLSDFWQLVYRQIKQLPVNCRDDIAAIYHFLCKTVFNWPNSVVQTWIRETERTLCQQPIAVAGEKLIGWGTGGGYRSLADAHPMPLSYLVDNDTKRWGESLDGLQIYSPNQLLREDPEDVIVLVYSSYLREIGRQIEDLGPFRHVSAASLLAEKEYLPILRLIGYYQQVELHYPRIFADDMADSRIGDLPDSQRRLDDFLCSEMVK